MLWLIIVLGIELKLHRLCCTHTIYHPSSVLGPHLAEKLIQSETRLHLYKELCGSFDVYFVTDPPFTINHVTWIIYSCIIVLGMVSLLSSLVCTCMYIIILISVRLYSVQLYMYMYGVWFKEPKSDLTGLVSLDVRVLIDFLQPAEW